MRLFLHLFTFAVIFVVITPHPLEAQSEGEPRRTKIAYNYKDLKNETDYVGIGVVIQRERENPWLPIRRVLTNGPAQEAGLKEGDNIVKINGEFVVEKSIEEIAKMMVGEINSNVTIQYMRNHRFHTVSVTRQPITF